MLKWMRFDDRVKYRKSIVMYKSQHNLAPTYLSNKFTLTYQTLYVPKPNFEIYHKSVSYSGLKVWSTVPELIRNALS